MIRRRKKSYFKVNDDAPAPIIVESKCCVNFSEVDMMGIAWHGRYPVYFEKVATEIGNRCGLSYKELYDVQLQAPIIEFHIDYYKPLYLDEEFIIRGILYWHDGPRLNTEYHILKKDGSIATSGYTVQLFINSKSWEVCLVSPDLLEKCHKRWKSGEFF